MLSRGALTRRRLVRAATIPVIGAAALALAASPGAAQTQQPNLPFARGQLVSRSGSTLDIQGFNGDSKVIVTGSTKYQQTQTADPSAVKVGACIRVTGTGSASKGITATSVALTPAQSNCTRTAGAGAFGGRFRNGNGGANGNANRNGGANGNTNGQAPLGFGNNGSGTNGNSNGTTNGNGNGTNPNRRNFANFGMVTGKVTKVTGDNIVVKGAVLQAPAKANAKPKMTTKSVKVTLSNSTRVDETVSATPDVLVAGTCVTAAGTADSVGTVTANTVIVSQPVNGSCTGGFGFGGGRRFGGDGQGGPNGSGAPTTSGNSGSA
jgi:hypothetical protein